jgi:hypothetical protein
MVSIFKLPTPELSADLTLGLLPACPSSARDPKTSLALPPRERPRQSPDGEAVTNCLFLLTVYKSGATLL